MLKPNETFRQVEKTGGVEKVNREGRNGMAKQIGIPSRFSIYDHKTDEHSLVNVQKADGRRTRDWGKRGETWWQVVVGEEVGRRSLLDLLAFTFEKV